ncbi:MAG TPA: hypothetical protein VM580_26495 [Labilithrix sp.]|nr:hypothetical protein [Labilithrix sp.]
MTTSAFPFVRSVRPQLETLASYACLDAAMFSRWINPSNKILIMDRLRRARDRRAKDAGAAAAFQIGTRWDANALAAVHRRVTAERAGVCTTFAKAAGHILGTAPGLKPRIEIVAYPGHVFVVVGRTGDYGATIGNGLFAKKLLPGYGDWGDEWVLVDPWAGAMGYHSVIYPDSMIERYPFPGMLARLSLVMERPADPDACIE